MFPSQQTGNLGCGHSVFDSGRLRSGVDCGALVRVLWWVENAPSKMSGILPILRKANNNILAGLIEKADLNNALNGDPLAEPGDLKDLTLFAPMDGAFKEFEGLPAARDDPELAKKLVLAHVVEGKVLDLKNLDGMKKANLDGGEVLFRAGF